MSRDTLPMFRSQATEIGRQGVTVVPTAQEARLVPAPPGGELAGVGAADALPARGGLPVVAVEGWLPGRMTGARSCLHNCPMLAQQAQHPPSLLTQT